MIVSRFCAAVAGVMLLAPFFAHSGTLDSPAAPTGTSSAMYTLTDIYNRQDTGTETPKRAGAFTDPPSGTIAGTGKTLDEVMDLVNSRAPVAKTGQILSYSAAGTTTIPSGQDGALQRGFTWPNPRFTDNNNGTVKDNLTGLIWLKIAGGSGLKNWRDAVSFCNSLASGSAGLSDGSVAGDWRLPNIKEITSLINYGTLIPPILPLGHPFSAQIINYWSSTSSGTTTATGGVEIVPNEYAWGTDMSFGMVTPSLKTNTYYVWPVRGGQ